MDLRDTPGTQADPDGVRDACRRFLSGHPARSMRDWCEALARSEHSAGRPDLYGQGEVVESLERRVADLLGKPSAMFVIKGVIAQQAALRTWTDRSGTPTVAVHPRSHVDLDESAGYERLHGLAPVRLGDVAPFTVADLDGVAERLGAVIVELPLRRAGFRLTPWDELCSISAWCRDRGVPLHLDGARLWEAAAGYGRDPAEIAALADSVYVSFYKGLRGLGGCVLAGPADLVRTARLWAGRHGANMFSAFPYVVSAHDGLDTYLRRMPAYRERALGLARALAAVPGVRVAPEPPHTNAFQLHLPARPEQVGGANLEVASAESVWLFGRAVDGPLPGTSVVEVQVGENTAEVGDDEAAALVTGLLDRASAAR